MQKKVLISLLLVIMWMAFIFIMSSLSGEESNGTSKSISSNVISTVDKVTSASTEAKEKHQDKSFIDKINLIIRKFSHALEYFVLGILVLNLFYQMGRWNFLYIIYTLLFNFIYACTDEYHQTFVNGRTGQFVDVFIDTIGALLGATLFFFIIKMLKRGKKAPKFDYN